MEYNIQQYIKDFKPSKPLTRKDLLWRLAYRLRDEAWVDGLNIPAGLDGFKKTAKLAKQISDHRLFQLVNINERISYLFYSDRKNAPKVKKPKQTKLIWH